MRRLNKENRCGGRLKRICLETDAAIDSELALRTVQGTLMDTTANAANAASNAITAITARSVDVLETRTQQSLPTK